MIIQDSFDLDCLVRAHRLIAPDLALGREPEYQGFDDSTFFHLRGLGFGDEFSLSKLIAQEHKRTDLDLFKLLDELCHALFVYEKGMPVLKHSFLTHYLVRFIDPDLLRCLHPGLKLTATDPFNWAAMPALERLRLGAGDQSTVDTHIHLGGALPPLYFWCVAMTGMLKLNVLSNKITQSNPKRRELWRRRLNRAAWLRMALTEALRALPFDDPFPHLKPGAEVEGFAEGLEILKSSEDGDLESFRELTTRFTGLRPLHEGDLPVCDLLRPNQRQHNAHFAEGERRLLHGLRKRWSFFPDKPHMETMLLDYIRIRNAFHRLLAYEVGEAGLNRFTESLHQRRGFQIKTRHKRVPVRRRSIRVDLAIERNRMAMALDIQLTRAFGAESVRNGLHRLEMRVSMPAKGKVGRFVHAWLAGIQDHLRAAHGDAIVKANTDTAAFLEKIECTSEAKSALGALLDPSHPVPSHVGLIVQFHKKADKTEAEGMREARRMAIMLKAFPQLRPFILGVDTAGSERGNHPRQIATAYRFLQLFEEHFRPLPGDPEIQLGYTYHVGEDTEDFLTGLRHVDEAIHLLLPPCGGRLGHGLILGEDPARYYATHPGYFPERKTYLLSLVWALGCLLECERFDLSQRVRNWIKKLNPDLQDAKLAQCYATMMKREAEPWPEDFQDPLRLLPGGTYKRPASELELLKILDNPERETYSKTITIKPDVGDLELLREIQACTRRRALRRRITLEVSPSSNVLVAKYPSYGDLPYLAMTQAGLSLSLNTDDPGMFITTLANEFGLMYQGMIERNNEDPATRTWLDQLRINGLSSSFMRQSPPKLHYRQAEAKAQRAQLLSPASKRPE